jgi:hypothetical protein
MYLTKRSYRVECAHNLITQLQKEPNMTRNEYELIARSIRVDRESLDVAGKKAADLIAIGLADQLLSMNPKFNRLQFLEDCGVGE